jgi:cell division protein FtsL
MSQPARTLPARPIPAHLPTPVPSRRARPAPRPAPPPRTAPPRPSTGVNRARRSRSGFLILSSVLVGSMVLGLVALNALLAQSSFRVDDLEQRVGVLTQENLELTRQQAALSAPGRIAAWARSHGMRLPDEIRFLHVPAARTAAPAGSADHDPPTGWLSEALP